MFKSIKYVFSENFHNLYRIYSIAKYELLADMRDSKFGIFWNFASPAVQVLTYWLIFGIAWDKQPIDGVPYLAWLIVGYSLWSFINPCLTGGCNAIFSKTSVITKMRFPVSILPATVCAKNFFNHLCMMVIVFVVILCFGYTPNVYWLQLIYYAFCAFVFAEGVSLILSVLNMIWRDIRKLVVSLIRMLMYFSPVIWECELSDSTQFASIVNFILKLNPCYYVINGYRDCFFYKEAFWEHPELTLYFWCFVIVLYLIGCPLMYKFRKKFIDYI